MSSFNATEIIMFLHRMAIGNGISGNLEMSGNFKTKLGKVGQFYLREMNIAEASSRFIQVVNKN